jgi:hypothetical protein
MSIEEISDRIQINDLLVRYTVALDTKDWDLLDTCFTLDTQLDYSAAGGAKAPYPDVRTWLQKTLAAFSMTQHFIGNSTVEIERDSASSRTYLINPLGSPKPDGGLHIYTLGAYYDDRLVYTDDGWRIAERIMEHAYFDGSLPESLEIPE